MVLLMHDVMGAGGGIGLASEPVFVIPTAIPGPFAGGALHIFTSIQYYYVHRSAPPES